MGKGNVNVKLGGCWLVMGEKKTFSYLLVSGQLATLLGGLFPKRHGTKFCTQPRTVQHNPTYLFYDISIFKHIYIYKDMYMLQARRLCLQLWVIPSRNTHQSNAASTAAHKLGRLAGWLACYPPLLFASVAKCVVTKKTRYCPPIKKRSPGRVRYT